MTRAVVIIDGDAQYVPLLRDVFRRVGFEVFVADDGDQGIALVRKHTPDLVMLSVELPAGPAAGYLVCRDLKSDADLKTIPVLMTSRRAKEDDFTKHRKLKTRADDYLRKPFTDEDLFQRVENILGFQLTNADFEALEAKMHRFLEREDELVAEVADRDRRIRDLEAALAAAQAQSEHDAADAADAATQVADNEAWAELRTRAEEAEAELKLAHRRADRAAEDARASAARVEELEAESFEREERLAEAVERAEQALLAVVDANARAEELEQQRQATETARDELAEKLAQAQAALEAVVQDKATLEEALAAAQARADQLDQAVKDCERELKKSQKAMAKVRAAAHKLLEALPEAEGA